MKLAVKCNGKSYARKRALKKIKINGVLCEDCKVKIATQRHHEDYNKPLEVVLLCRKCHYKRHLEYPEILEKICPNCNKFFFRGKREMRDWRKIRFCSNKCKHDYTKKRIKLICKFCKKEFEIPICWEKKGNGKYCSRKCMGLDKKGKTFEEWFGKEKAKEVKKKMSDKRKDELNPNYKQKKVLIEDEVEMKNE